MTALRACCLGVLCALCVAACGGASDTDRIRQTVKLFADSTAQHDYTTLCQKVLAPELIAKLKPFNLSCEIAVRHYFGDVRNASIEIRGIRLTEKAQAIAAVQSSAAGQPPAPAQLGLVKTAAGWRIARLANNEESPRPGTGPAPPAGPSSPTTPND